MEDQSEFDESPVALVAATDAQLALLKRQVAAARIRMTELGAEDAALGHHPNYPAYVHGGLVAVRDMGADHILAHAGFYRLPHAEAIARLGDARGQSDADCLIVALKTLCESDPMLEVAGLAWLGERGLLWRGVINPFWLRRPLLGLGQPAKLHGLEPEHMQGHRALYTLTPPELATRFAEVADRVDDPFGDLIAAVIDAGGSALTAMGAEAIERDAAERYAADCAGFHAHQRATGDRRWRWKPPFSRQGHLAVTTAQVRGVPVPTERTRGHAATWLDDNGANPRFRED